jgi:hypothetical protein
MPGVAKIVFGLAVPFFQLILVRYKNNEVSKGSCENFGLSIIFHLHSIHAFQICCEKRGFIAGERKHCFLLVCCVKQFNQQQVN